MCVEMGEEELNGKADEDIKLCLERQSGRAGGRHKLGRDKRDGRK